MKGESSNNIAASTGVCVFGNAVPPAWLAEVRKNTGSSKSGGYFTTESNSPPHVTPNVITTNPVFFRSLL